VKRIGLLGAISRESTSEHCRLINEHHERAVNLAPSADGKRRNGANDEALAHALLCGLLIAAGVVLVSTGAGAAAVIPAAGCAAMTAMMAWMMMRCGGR
jgi:hypothetical protein